LNWHNIRREIAKCDLKFPEIVMLQIRLETGGLTSRLCLECNNLTGMKRAVKRKTTAIGREKNGAAVYATWQDCLKDYKAWQDYMYKGGDYLNFLSRVYATDPYYVSKLKRL
jgi:flagellum-specific peptidoglycan hydrolase FlgJ